MHPLWKGAPQGLLMEHDSRVRDIKFLWVLSLLGQLPLLPLLPPLALLLLLPQCNQQAASHEHTASSVAITAAAKVE